MQSLQDDDVAYALSSLSFEESLQIFVDEQSANSDPQPVTGKKLCAVIQSLMRIVPGSNEQLFYYCGNEIDESAFRVVPNNVVGPSLGNSGDDVMVVESQYARNGELLEGEETNHQYPNIDDPPLFFRFTLDQEVVGFNELLTLKKSGTLAAQVSVFRRKSISGTVDSEQGMITSHRELPNHVCIVSKLQIQLIRFSSEQTLEKYRFMGRLLTVPILEEVMLTLPKTNHVSCEIQLEIFTSKSNSLITVEGSNENDLIHGINVRMNEFDNAGFTRASRDSFLVLDDSASREVLPYWCFAEIQPRGIIRLRVY